MGAWHGYASKPYPSCGATLNPPHQINEYRGRKYAPTWSEASIAGETIMEMDRRPAMN